MRVKLIIIILIFSIILLDLTAEEFTIDMLISNLDNNIHFTKAEALSQMGLYDYKTARASLYPTISSSIPFTLSDTEVNNIPQGTGNQQDRIITIEPGITVNQLLPTAGTLTTVVSNSIAKSESTVSEWANTVGISINLLQPVFYRGAFEAALEIMNKTYENTDLSALTAKNSIVLSAVESYYNLKQAIFNLELVQIRFIRDQENFKRINQEFEMGLWTKSELYQARSILIKSEIDLLEAEQVKDISNQSLRTNYSLPGNFTVSSNVDSLVLDETNFNSILTEVISNNPAANQAKNILNIQKSSLVILRKDSGPVLSLGGSYSYLTNIENSDSNQKVLTLSLGLSGNIFDGGAQNAKMESGKALVVQRGSDLSAVLIDLEIQTKNLLNSILRTKQLKELYSFQEEAAQYEFDKGLKDLELGHITEKDLSELQIDLENIKLSKQQNIINTNILYLQLADLQGVDLLNHPIFRNRK